MATQLVKDQHVDLRQKNTIGNNLQDKGWRVELRKKKEKSKHFSACVALSSP